MLEASAAEAALAQATPAELRRAIAETDAALRQPGVDSAKAALRKIVKAYPLADLADPGSFLQQAVEAIEDYPAVVVEALADPKTGIVRQSKFLPRIAELVEWCDREMGRYDSRLSVARSALWQAEEAERKAREAMERAKHPEPDPAHCAAMQSRLKAVLGRIRKRSDMASASRKPGSSSARNAWEAAMCRSLQQRPDLVEAYAKILSEQPSLCERATEEERLRPNLGWPWLSQQLAAIYLAEKTG